MNSVSGLFSNLGLTRKHGDGDADERSDAGRDEDRLHVVERRDHSSHVRERQRLQGSASDDTFQYGNF